MLPVVAVALAACGGSAAPTLPTDPIEQAHIAFVGEPPADTIKRMMDATLEAHGLTPSDELYRRLGSTLIRLRMSEGNRAGCTELDILEAMDYQNLASFGVDVPDAAA